MSVLESFCLPLRSSNIHTFAYDLGSLRQHWAGPVDVFSAIQVSCPSRLECHAQNDRVQVLAEYKREIPREKLFQMRLSGKPTGHLNPRSELTPGEIPRFC